MTTSERSQQDGEANPKQWRSMSRDKRLSLVQTIFICYPRLKALAAKLDLCAQEADRAVANQLYLPVLIDQCEHLIDRQRQRINYQLLDLVEYLIASTTTSIVLIGHAAEIEMILQASPRLTRRVCSLFRLPPFTWNRRSPETVGEYCAFLHAFDRELPFDDSGLAEETMAYRLFYASDGYIGWTTRLIQQAAAMALEAESPTITRSCLAKAYETSIAETPLGWQKTNPFLPEQFKEPSD